MKKDKRPEMTSAMQRSWRPGGPSRIAYEKRMQEKKTTSVVDQTGEFRRLMEDHRTSQPAAEAIGHPKPEIHFTSHMYRAAAKLLLADPLQRDHAARLIAAADALLGDDQ